MVRVLIVSILCSPSSDEDDTGSPRRFPQQDYLSDEKAALARSARADGAARSRNQKTVIWITSKSGTYKVGMNQATPRWKNGRPIIAASYRAYNRSMIPTRLNSQTNGSANPGWSRSMKAESPAKPAVRRSP